jgi:geranylgeranyl reductase family protein
LTTSRLPQFDVIIVGSGPAGISTAMHLMKLEPALRDRMVVLEKAIHPRKKVCGGGLSPYGMYFLKELGISLDMPLKKVVKARIVVDSHGYSERVLEQPVDLFTVMREEFDETLVRSARSLGIEIIEDEAALSFDLRDHESLVRTKKRDLSTKVLVGADGAASAVRRALNKQSRPGDQKTLGTAMRFLQELDESMDSEHKNHEAVVDFSCTFQNGIRGYAWLFPVISQGQVWLNTGVASFDISKKSERSLKRILKEFLAAKGISMDENRLEAHPMRWFHPSSPFSAHRVLLVGDAAGIDPLSGEGISFSLGYGQIAASAIVQAFENNDFSFSLYKQQVLEHETGKSLINRLQLADRLYRSPVPDNMTGLFLSVLFQR